MSATLSDLKAEESALKDVLSALQEASKAMGEATGKTARIRKFQIGRTEVEFHSPLDVASAISQTVKDLRAIRKDIAAYHRNNTQFQTHGGGLQC